MKRYLVAALAAGILYALLGPVFVHFVLDESLREELTRVFAKVSGEAPQAADAAGGSNWGQFALHIVLRVLFGFLTMAVFVVLARKRPRFRAARIAGAAFWLLAYVAWPVFLAVRIGMSTTLLFVCMGYGLVETQLAAHVGALAWGRGAKKP
jgi:hypothetical protein